MNIKHVPQAHTSYSLTHSLAYSLTHSLAHSLTHSLIHSLTRSFTHSFLHSLTQSLSQSVTHSLTHRCSFNDYLKSANDHSAQGSSVTGLLLVTLLYRVLGLLCSPTWAIITTRLLNLTTPSPICLSHASFSGRIALAARVHYRDDWLGIAQGPYCILVAAARDVDIAWSRTLRVGLRKGRCSRVI